VAVSSIAVPPDPKRDARAHELAPLVGTWPKYTLRQAWGSFEAGTVFRRATASSGARHYLVNAVACECPDYQQGGYICKHVRAVVLWEQRRAAEDAEIDRVLGLAPKRRYEALFPACKEGCGDLSDMLDGYCSKCGSDREWQARREAAAR
jgi:hypothetical protein